jgi:hypothetical protein
VFLFLFLYLFFHEKLLFLGCRKESFCEKEVVVMVVSSSPSTTMSPRDLLELSQDDDDD